MIPSGPSAPGGGAPSISPSLLRTNSGILGASGGSGSSPQSFPSLLSPRSQYTNMNILGNTSSVSSLLNHSIGGAGSNTGVLPLGSFHHGSMDMGGIESEPLSGMTNSMSNFNTSFTQQNNGICNPSLHNQPFQSSPGVQTEAEQSQSHQLESQGFLSSQSSNQQFHGQHHHQQQQQLPQSQYQAIRSGLSGVLPAKGDVQVPNEQNGSLRNLGPLKLETQHQPLRNLGPMKMESHSSDQPIFLQQQQQQQQQLLRMSRQSPQAASQLNMLRHQSLLQFQQQQQLLKNIPHQRAPLQQHFQQQNLPVRSLKPMVYEPGMCARRLTHYMYHQQHRPTDNNIEFWRKFVAEYYAPNAKKRWCVSLYGMGRQTTGVFPQDVWHCEICNRKPGRGFETTVEVLPRLCKIKYDSGTLEELLYVDMPHEYQNASGQIVLDYAKAVQESVFDQLRVVREGQLRIVFSSDLKICSWEFCARRHEELIPRRLLIPQISQLGAVAQKYQAATQNPSSNVSPQDLQNNCNMFIASARQLAKALEVPLVNDLGYTKRYVRCLQISEVVNSMKDLIDYGRETGTGPMASLINFPRRTAVSSNYHSQQPDEQRTMSQNCSNDLCPAEVPSVLVSSSGVNANISTTHVQSSGSTPSPSLVGALQNTLVSGQETSVMNAGSYLGSCSAVQIPSAGSSTSLPPAQQSTAASPFSSPTQQSSHSAFPATSTANSPSNVPMLQSSESGDPSESQSSMQQIIQEMIMSSQLSNNIGGIGPIGNDAKGLNGTEMNRASVGSCLANGLTNGIGFGSHGGASSSGSARVIAGNGRIGLGSIQQDVNVDLQNHDIGGRLLNGLSTVNNLNGFHFDWKTSP